ncbi:MAG TPA: hypothetical protein VFV39_05935 [Limnobacter sp.]|nr:hypothetical protein [Limnobacter sp.]
MPNWIRHGLASILCLSALSYANVVQAQTWKTSDIEIQNTLGFAAFPQDVVATPGAEVTLSVMVSGPVKHIQWRKNGVAIEHGTERQLTVLAPVDQFNPDLYDVEIRDAFGNRRVSAAAAVRGKADGSSAVSEHINYQNWLKVQAIFELTQLFQQAVERLDEEIGSWDRGMSQVQKNLTTCNAMPEGQWINPRDDEMGKEIGLKLVLKDCLLPRFNQAGEKEDVIVSGQYLQTVSKQSTDQTDTRTHEKFARDLSFRFVQSQPSKMVRLTNFDTLLNGKLTHTVQRFKIGTKGVRTKETYEWSKNTTIVNPQTGVEVRFLGGRYGKEEFGNRAQGGVQLQRSSEFFHQLKLEVNGKPMMLDGLVTRIYGGDEVNRSGQFSVSLNGKTILTTPGVGSPLRSVSGELPFVPKFVGLFANDHLPSNEPANSDNPKVMLGKAY